MSSRVESPQDNHPPAMPSILIGAPSMICDDGAHDLWWNCDAGQMEMWMEIAIKRGGKCADRDRERRANQTEVRYSDTHHPSSSYSLKVRTPDPPHTYSTYKQR